MAEKKSKKKTFKLGDVRYKDDDGREYGVSKREMGIQASTGNKDAAKALKRMKNHKFVYPDKILMDMARINREKKSMGGLIKGKPKLATKGWK